jgi:hypothetical protein
LTEKIYTTSFVIIMLYNPQIITDSFSLFNCINYEDGFSYLKFDTTVRCWSPNHILMAITIGGTFIFIYAIMFPTVIIWRLYSIKDEFNNKRNLKMYGIFYIGLSDGSYYWEICIVHLRKLLLIICATFIGGIY